MSRPCQIDSRIETRPAEPLGPPRPTRRRFLRDLSAGVAGLTGADFLSYFLRFGMPREARAETMARDAAREAENRRFLIYWFLEGGWCGYDMFNPVMTPNNVVHRLDDISQERYRVLRFGEPGYGIYRKGDLRYGYLARPGEDLLDDLAIVSSMSTGTGHSRERLKAHMGSYRLSARADREPDERSVLQAFAEVHGQPYALPHLSWHWWLSDGELNEAQYTGRKGYYHALGPSHAHTIYAGPPARLKRILAELAASTGDRVNRAIQDFVDDAGSQVLKDDRIEVVKSYHSARQIYKQLVQREHPLDRGLVSRLFRDAELREDFQVRPADELLTYRSVNGNKARTKFAPRTNVQAMMTYELLRSGLSCCAWIESRDVRRFDSHLSRGRLWRNGKPVGQKDQSDMMREDLWDPLRVLVRRLRSTPVGEDGESLYDRTTIVLTSEFGRSIHGDVSRVVESKASAKEKKTKIDGQDISAHWPITSAAFLGGKVEGGRQYGGVGEQTLRPIPLLPDGTPDPAFDPITGAAIPGRTVNARASIPDHGDIYATALYLSDLDPAGRGRNERPPLRYIKKGHRWF